MNKFELVPKSGRIVLTFAVAVGAGLVAILVSYGLIARFSNWTATRIMPLALGIGAVVAVGMSLNALFGTIKKLELDDQRLRIQMLAGGVKEYRLSENRFAPKISHQTNRGQHVSTTRALEVVGPHGTDTHTINFEPEEFNELINRLTGRSLAAPQAPGQAQAPAAPAATGARQPLDFPPQQFEISRKPVRKYNIAFYVLAAVMVAFGLVVAALTWGEGVGMALGLFGLFLFFALLCLIPVLVMRRRAAKLPKQIVVAPTWVSFDGRAFNYNDLKVIQIKPQGEFINRSAKILTRADERVVYELGIGAYRKMFAEYDQFAHLLEQAGTAAAGVVRIDWS